MATRANHRRIWSFWVVALIAGFTLGACGAAPAGLASSHTSTDAAVTSLQVLAQKMAAGADDPNVTAGEAVLTTRQAAVTATSGDLVNTNEPAYLVQLQGQFTALDASVPPGQSLPTGTYLNFIVDATGGSVTDWGVTNRQANLSALGSVIALSW
jgi:hypothetical protein